MRAAPPGTPKRQARKHAVEAAAERRRSAPPTRCHAINDREYTDEEQEFITATLVYRQAKAVLFMTAVDYLDMIKILGYEKVSRPV